ncbi:MAG: hypothetical protein Q9184_003001 [Pyrenodesmia sp. 2 TL-2023]
MKTERAWWVPNANQGARKATGGVLCGRERMFVGWQVLNDDEATSNGRRAPAATMGSKADGKRWNKADKETKDDQRKPGRSSASGMSLTVAVGAVEIYNGHRSKRRLGKTRQTE